MAKSKSKNILAIIAVLLFLVYGLPMLKGGIPNMIGSGFTVNSMSPDVSVISPSTDLNEVWWLISTSFTGGGQSLAGTITTDDAKMKGSAYGTKFPLTISASAVDESLTYNIINQGQTIYKYVLDTQVRPTGFSGIIWNPSCAAGTTWSIPMKDRLGIQYRLYCITKQPVGVKGILNNPNVKFRANIKLEANGKVLEKEISSTDTSVDFYDGTNLLATAQWSGSLVTGDSPPTQANFVAVYDDQTASAWHLNYVTDWDSYTQKAASAEYTLQTPVTLEFNTWAEADQYVSNLVLEPNRVSTKLLQTPTTLTSSQVMVNPADKTSGTAGIKISLDRSITSPQITFKAKASWIGIVIPISKPVVESCTSTLFYSGNSAGGIANVVIRNDGSKGTVEAAFLDCSPFTQAYSGASNRADISAGGRVTMPIAITGGTAAQEITKTCSVKAYDYNNPASTTTMGTCTITMKKPQKCEPNKVSVSGTTISTCRPDGSDFDYQYCSNGIIYDANGKPTCATAPPTCISMWNTGDWSACANSLQKRNVTDANKCVPSNGEKPAAERACGTPSKPPPTPTPIDDTLIYAAIATLVIGYFAFFNKKGKKGKFKIKW